MTTDIQSSKPKRKYTKRAAAKKTPAKPAESSTSAVGCSARTYQLISLIAEIKGASRSSVLEDMAEKYVCRG